MEKLTQYFNLSKGERPASAKAKFCICHTDTKMKLRVLHFPKCTKNKLTVFLLLLTTLLIALLTDTKSFPFRFNLWMKTEIQSNFTRTDFAKIPSPPPQTTRQSAVPQCSFTHLSPENAQEGRKLLNSITWPDTPPLPKPFSLNLTTSRAHSSFTIVPRSGGWRVGDELTVRIHLRDYHGNPKKSGGDFLISKLHNRKLGAGVVGQIQDHLNGTFTATFPLLWNGTADVEVTLVQTSESIMVLKRLTEEQPDRIFFGSEFRSRSIKKRSTCNVCLDPKKNPLCNFTDLITGEQWFCNKPKDLDCNTRISHFKGGTNQKISKDEETLFQKDINMKVSIEASGSKTILILPKAGKSVKVALGISGNYYKNQWQPVGDSNVRRFNNASVITACLKGKQLHLLGDSTIRLFYEHLTNKVPNLLTFDKHISHQSGPMMALDHTNDIMVTYRCHGPPIRFADVPVSQLRYVANEVDGLVGGPNTVVVIGVWSHFSTFPLEVYYQRLMTIRRAVQRLLNRAPESKVIIRTANMKALTLYESLTNSDWYSLQRDKVLRAVFKDMDVLLLEAWEMVQAHYLPHSLHPQPEITEQMINVILSYTCPVLFAP